MSHKVGEWWTDGKKIEVVTAYLVLGKAPMAEAVTGVPAGTIRRWKREQWWDDLVNQIQLEDTQELDAKLTSRLNKALDIVNDRLDSGDFMFDPKSGEFRRRPVSLKDTWTVGREMVDLRAKLRKEPKERKSEEAVGDILKNLAKDFAAMAKKEVREHAAKLQIGVPELSGEPGTDQEAQLAEQSPAIDGKSGIGY